MRDRHARTLVLVVCAAACLLASLAPSATLAEETLRGEGRVVAVDRSKGSMTLEHGPIADLLLAGRTEFPVLEADLLGRVGVDDHVAFVLTPVPEAHGVLAISALSVRTPSGQGPVERAVTATNVGVAVLAGLLAAMVGMFVLQSRRLRRLIEQGDVMVGMLRVQARRAQELDAGMEAGAAALAAMIRGYHTDLRRVSERVRRVLGGTQRDGEGAPPKTTRPIVIVRKGETETFRLLEERLAKPGLARIVWDRRQGERRSTPAASRLERRRHERRGSTPLTWEGLGYLVVEPRARHLTVVA